METDVGLETKTKQNYFIVVLTGAIFQPEINDRVLIVCFTHELRVCQQDDQISLLLETLLQQFIVMKAVEILLVRYCFDLFIRLLRLFIHSFKRAREENLLMFYY